MATNERFRDARENDDRDHDQDLLSSINPFRRRLASW